MRLADRLDGAADALEAAVDAALATEDYPAALLPSPPCARPSTASSMRSWSWTRTSCPREPTAPAQPLRSPFAVSQTSASLPRRSTPSSHRCRLAPPSRPHSEQAGLLVSCIEPDYGTLRPMANVPCMPEVHLWLRNQRASAHRADHFRFARRHRMRSRPRRAGQFEEGSIASRASPAVERVQQVVDYLVPRIEEGERIAVFHTIVTEVLRPRSLMPCSTCASPLLISWVQRDVHPVVSHWPSGYPGHHPPHG